MRLQRAGAVVFVAGCLTTGTAHAHAGCLTTGTAHAHGVVGERSFIEPFITEDVNPKNEFVIARPQWTQGSDAKTMSLGFGLEKKIADMTSITLEGEWDSVSPLPPDEPQTTGFNNLGITLKQAFFINPEHEAIVSAAVEATAPVGSAAVGAEQDWSFKPFLLYGKGFGDLPKALRFLRPLAVQGDIGPEIGIDHARTTVLDYNFAWQYSIPYLQSSVYDLGWGWPFNDLIAVTEFNFEHGVHGEDSGQARYFTTPGIVYMDRFVEIGVAGRFPLTAQAHNEINWGVIGIVDLFIDDIFPFTKWQPF
jgi:hypothetical protein